MAMQVEGKRFPHVRSHRVKRATGKGPAGAFQPAIEAMPREQLAELQLKRLRSSLKNAWDHVPLHRTRMESLGVRPQDVRSLADVAKLPFTVKDDLRTHTRVAAQRGVFGVPSFAVGDELFWGSDVLDDVVAHLEGRDPVPTDMFRKLVALRPSAVRKGS